MRFWLSPERTEPTMKTMSAPRKTFRRLQRSESLAKIGMLAVEAMTYALMTKVPLFGCRTGCRIVGSAVRATKLSSAPIRRANRIPTIISNSDLLVMVTEVDVAPATVPSAVSSMGLMFSATFFTHFSRHAAGHIIG